jgi:hypothetical protein
VRSLEELRKLVESDDGPESDSRVPTRSLRHVATFAVSQFRDRRRAHRTLCGGAQVTEKTDKAPARTAGYLQVFCPGTAVDMAALQLCHCCMHAANAKLPCENRGAVGTCVRILRPGRRRPQRPTRPATSRYSSV